MDSYLDHRDISQLGKKKYKHLKPFWNNHLQNSWRAMVEAEKAYRKYNGHRNTKNMLKSKFIGLRNIFDKLLRKTEREYNSKVIYNLENTLNDNPREFWKKIKQFGPGRSNIPFKVENNGVLTSDPEIVLNTWKNDFQQLYNPSVAKADQSLLTRIEHEKIRLENEMNNDERSILNAPISVFEVIQLVVLQSKL